MAQRAADAAALAGCMVSELNRDDDSGTGVNAGRIIEEANNYSALNGYASTETFVTPAPGGDTSKVAVRVSRSERVFFTPVLEFLLGSNPAYSRVVSASATAQKETGADLSFGGNYGTTTGASNPAVFGPYAKHSYGDPYSVKYHDNGQLNNAANIGMNKGTGVPSNAYYDPNGYSYTMKVSPEYVADPKNSVIRVELYDPDGYDSKDGKSLDEIHTDYLGPTKPAVSEATTEYTISFYDPATKKLTPIASAVYGNDKSTDAAYLASLNKKNVWVTPNGFKFSTALHGAGEYKITVRSIDGSSENGYNLRAGPDFTQDWTETEWNQANGDQGGTNPGNVKIPITADDRFQMNFTRTQSDVKVQLGYLPASVAGQKITVTKFDTDVGSNSIKYFYRETPDIGKPGGDPKYITGNNFLDNRNDYWSQDTVAIPKDFAGGYWYAQYDAGQNDTSSWSIKYPGPGTGQVRLVK